MTNRLLGVFCARSIFAAVLTILILAAVGQRQFGTYPSKNFDFEVYFFTAQLIQENPKDDIYFDALNGNPQLREAPPDSPIFRKAQQAGIKGVMLYLYPPLLADLLVPLAHHSESAAVKIWHLCALLCLCVSIGLIGRLMKIGMLTAEFLVLATGFYCFFPVIECITAGQVTIAMLALYSLSLYSFARGHHVVSGAVLAIATALKVTPLMILPLFIIWNYRRWLVGYVTTLVALIVCMMRFNGLHTLATSVRVLEAMGGSVPSLLNRCISALLAWLYYGRVFGSFGLPIPTPALALASKLVSLGFYGFSVFLVWRGRRSWSSAQRVTIIAVFAVVVLLTSPVACRHGYAMALPALALLWGQALQEEGLTRRTILLAVASISLGTILFDVVAAHNGVPQPVKIVFSSISVVSCILLCLDVLGRGLATTAEELTPAG